MDSKKASLSRTLIYALLFLGSIGMFFPFIWMILSSFKPDAEVIMVPPTILPAQPTIENFTTVWQQFAFALFFRNSMFLALVKTTIVLYTSALCGYVLSKIEFKGRNTIFLVVLATMMVPWPVTIIPMYQQMVWLKFLGNYSSLIIPAIFNSFGIYMMRQFMDTIPIDIIEAGRIDGSSEFGIFHRIVFANITPALSALGIFTFLWTWDDFLWPYLMINDSNKYTLPVGLSLFNGRFQNNYGGMLAGASVAVIPVLIVYLFFQSKFIEGIAMTGIKG